MFQRTLAAIGLLAVLALLGAAATRTLTPASPVPTPTTTGPLGIRVADLPMSRHFYQRLQLGPSTLGSSITEATVPLPAGVGLVIREITAPTSQLSQVKFEILENGNSRVVGSLTSGQTTLSPPAVFMPGSAVMVRLYNSGGPELSVGGYIVFAGEI